jgi:hypothetical protein
MIDEKDDLLLLMMTLKTVVEKDDVVYVLDSMLKTIPYMNELIYHKINLVYQEELKE